MRKDKEYLIVDGKPFYPTERVHKAILKSITANYIDYKRKENDDHFYFAYILPEDFKDHDIYSNILRRLKHSIVQNKKINLVIERRPGHENKNQLMDYVISAEFYS